MIHSNPNPPMNNNDVKRFLDGMARRMRGEFTPEERERIAEQKKVYDTILKHNGGKNPILGY